MDNRDIVFLKYEFGPKYYQKPIFDSQVLNAYYVAEKILKGLPQIQRRGCNCEYNRFQQQVNKLYEEWLHNSTTD